MYIIPFPVCAYAAIHYEGRRLMKVKVKKKSPDKVKKTLADQKIKTTTSPSNNRITNYLLKKKTGNQEAEQGVVLKDKNDMKTTQKTVRSTEDKKTPDNRVKKDMKKFEKNGTKLTFTTPSKKTLVKTKIDNFQKLARGDECVIGSGRCGSHNCKLVRSVVVKKMSVINKDGSLGWSRREVTTLACPYAAQSKDVSTSSSASGGGVASTNKKARISVVQSPHKTQIEEGDADTPLDRKE